MVPVTANYPPEFFQDLSQLLDASQSASILLLSEDAGDDILAYKEQRATIHLATHIEHYGAKQVRQGLPTKQRFDLTIVYDLIEHLDKAQAEQLLARIRDLHSSRFSIGLPLSRSSTWTRNELFAFSLRCVATYTHNQQSFGLFKYDLNSYKNTPEWLNSKNWANPNNWGKYRW